MKFVSESRKTLDCLQKQGRHYRTLQFFFDYRSGKNTANHTVGLLKLFIRQLIKQVPELAERLADEHTRQKLLGTDVAHHLDILAGLVQASDLQICAFIDGLDEYEGDAWALCTTLQTLRDRTGMKLCLASRPEIAFEITFAGLPTIIMQKHNRSSMDSYIRNKVRKFRTVHALHPDLLSESLQNAIAEKAQGVILWARLVVDEMIKSCTPTTTNEDLAAQLESLPPEMEPLYQRILEKGNESMRHEKSILLMLIDEDTNSTSSEVILQAWRYILASCGPESSLPPNFDFNACKSRVKALFGGLLEIAQVTKEDSEGDKHKYDTLRLLHKSLSTYLHRSAWISQHLSQSIREMYPDNVWGRLVYYVLSKTNEDLSIDVSELLNASREFTAMHTSKSQISRLKVDHKTDMVFEYVYGDAWWGLVGIQRRAEEALYASIEASKWKPFASLLRDCVSNAHQYETSSTVQDIHANELILVHMYACHMCTGLMCTAVLANHITHLYKEGLMSLIIKISSHRYEELSSSLGGIEPTSGRRTLLVLFDILVSSISGVYSIGRDLTLQKRHELRQIATYFARQAIYIEASSVCLGQRYFRNRYRSSGLSDFVCQRPKDAPRSVQHHDLCTYRHTTVGLLHHLPVSTLEEEDLLALIEMGVDINAPVYANGKHVFHRVLHDEGRWAMDVILAFAKACWHPDVSGGTGDVLAYAKRTHWKLRLKLRSSTSSLKREGAHMIVQVLEEYKKNGERWGGLDRWSEKWEQKQLI